MLTAILPAARPEVSSTPWRVSGKRKPIDEGWKLMSTEASGRSGRFGTPIYIGLSVRLSLILAERGTNLVMEKV